MANGNKVSAYRTTLPLGSAIELAAFIYASLFGNSPKPPPPRVSSRIPAMEAMGLDPGPRKVEHRKVSPPNFATRLVQAGWSDLNKGARWLDQALGHPFELQKVRGAQLFCNIEFNSSLAELRAVVEGMDLVLTSSKIPDANQEVDGSGQSILDTPALSEREEAVLIEHCVFILDQSLPKSQQMHLVATLEGIAEARNSQVDFYVSAGAASAFPCTGQNKVGEVRIDPCKLQDLYDYWLDQPLYNDSANQQLNGLPVVFTNASNIKWVEDSYGGIDPRLERTVVTIRKHNASHPRIDCQAKPPSAAGPDTSPGVAVIALALGIPLVAIAACAGGWYLGRRGKDADAETEPETATRVPETATRAPATATRASATTTRASETAASTSKSRKTKPPTTKVSNDNDEPSWKFELNSAETLGQT